MFGVSSSPTFGLSQAIQSRDHLFLPLEEKACLSNPLEIFALSSCILIMNIGLIQFTRLSKDLQSNILHQISIHTLGIHVIIEENLTDDNLIKIQKIRIVANSLP